MNIKIFSVGGTIDKIYFDELSEYQVGIPGVEEILKELPLTLDYQVESLMRKDSLDMTDTDRELVARKVEIEERELILITHGTDTMIETATAIGSYENKCVVLTGALQPAGFKASDAVFNIGMSMGVLASGIRGVHIVMNGQRFLPHACRKNRDAGRFEAT